MPCVFIGKWYFSSDELNHLNIVISSLFWPLILIYHGNLEQKIHIYFLLKWCNFLFTGDILKRKFDHLEVSGNRNGTPTTYFFNDNDSPTSHLYTPLQLLKLSQIESGIVLMQYWGWPPLCFLFLLRRLSGDPTEIFSVEKRFPPLYERLMLRSTNQTSFHLKAAFSKIFDGWSSFFYF